MKNRDLDDIISNDRVTAIIERHLSTASDEELRELEAIGYSHSPSGSSFISRESLVALYRGAGEELRRREARRNGNS